MNLEHPWQSLAQILTLCNVRKIPIPYGEKGKSIESQIARITTILDSIFSLQKLSDTNWRTQRVNISELLANLIKELKASRQQHTVSYAVPEKILLAIGNYDYLLEAFRQVLDNACRFTSLGEAIKVDVSDDGKQVFVDVRDDGIGIEEKDLPHVFEAFWRHDDAHTTPGLGVGLTIAREIITRHNGVIDIASKPNNGTHVRITLPLATDTDSGTKDKR
jgi:signal transduction histidine kinase